MKEMNAKFKALRKTGDGRSLFLHAKKNGDAGGDCPAALTRPHGRVVATDGNGTSLALPSRYGLDRVDQRANRRGTEVV
jgi:hypothetical protein